VCSSDLCAGELAWSGTVSWQAAFTGMANVHMLIGIGEALITVLVVRAIARIRPELVGGGEESGFQPGKMELLYGVILVLGIILFILPFASGWPDGLERVAAGLGFAQKAVSSPLVASPLGEYRFPGIGSPAGATAVAGLIGAVVVFLLGIGLAGVFRIRRTPPAGAGREE
jgi:cobalt/nickel transport system permease protein